jgi:Spy/CpxP family protein refolding chaperone
MKNSIILILCLFVSGLVFAQEESVEEGENSVSSTKVAFLSTKLKLTSEQAKTFWPLYEEFNKERRSNRQAMAQVQSRYTALSTDEEMKTGLQELTTLRQKGNEVEKKYLDKFYKVISPHQTAQLYKAELEWQNALLGGGLDSNPGTAAEKIGMKKQEYLNSRLKLNAEQAKGFWATYNELSAERKANRQALRELRRQINPESSDEEIKATLKNVLEVRQKEAETEKRYLDKFYKVITPRQTAVMLRAERDFQIELIRELRERRLQNQQEKKGEIQGKKADKREQRMEQLREKRQERKPAGGRD